MVFHARGIGGLHLALGNGLDTSPDDLREIGGLKGNEPDDCGNESTHGLAKQNGYKKVEPKNDQN